MKRTLLIFAAMLITFSAFAGGKQTDWKEIQSVVLSPSTQIYEGVNSKGNPKYWIMLTDIKVSISQANVEHLAKNDCKVELVKWFNSETGKYKYTTRKQKTPKKEIPNIDLNMIH